MAPWLANTVGLTGLLLLAWPALALNANAKRLSQLEGIDLGGQTGTFFKGEQQRLVEKRRNSLGTWRRSHELCLYFGYGLIVASYVLRYL